MRTYSVLPSTTAYTELPLTPVSPRAAKLLADGNAAREVTGPSEHTGVVDPLGQYSKLSVWAITWHGPQQVATLAPTPT